MFPVVPADVMVFPPVIAKPLAEPEHHVINVFGDSLQAGNPVILLVIVIASFVAELNIRTALSAVNVKFAPDVVSREPRVVVVLFAAIVISGSITAVAFAAPVPLA